jgi:hypothetical protein
MNKELQKMKCPRCGVRGEMVARVDAYADYELMENGEYGKKTITEFCDVIYECFACEVVIPNKEIDAYIASSNN